MDTLAILAMADLATRSALKILQHPDISFAERQDMNSAAAEKILRLQDKSEHYQFVSARNAALEQYFNWRYEIDRHAARRGDRSREYPRFVSLEAFSENWLPAASVGDDYVPSPLAPEQAEYLFKLFLDARNKKGMRGLQAAIRDTRIISMIVMGYSSDAIGVVLGTKPEYVRKYRQLIRKVLRNHISKKGETDG